MLNKISVVLGVLLDTLKQNKNVTISSFEINKGCTDEEIQHIQSGMNVKLPRELREFYTEMNGCNVEWLLKSPEGSLYAYLNIVGIKTAFYGYAGRNVISVDEAFRDVFWNDSFDKELIEDLKHHHLLESFEGRSENTTFKITGNSVDLFDVYEDIITPINLSFNEYIKTLIMWGGIETVRDEIVKKQSIPVEAFNNKSELFKNNFKHFYETNNVEKK